MSASADSARPQERPDGRPQGYDGPQGTCPMGAGRRSFVKTALGAGAGAAALAGGGLALSTVGGGSSAQADSA
ncbi:MAG TPA: hypothetical protein VGL02_01735, partial [Streptomyces sp.]